MEKDNLLKEIESYGKGKKTLAGKLVSRLDELKQAVEEMGKDDRLETLIRNMLLYIEQTREAQEKQENRSKDMDPKIEKILEASTNSNQAEGRIEKKLTEILGKFSEEEKQRREALADEKEKLSGQLEEVTIERNSLKTELDKQLDEKEKLTGDIQNLTAQLETFQAQKKKLDKTMKELGEEARAYGIYKDWRENGNETFDMIKATSFTDFIISLADVQNISSFYRQAALIVWSGVSQNAAEALNAVIDSGIRLANRAGMDAWSRQEVSEGDRYDGKLHFKNEKGAYNGTVQCVHLQGILKNGEIWDECKAYVEVGN